MHTIYCIYYICLFTCAVTRAVHLEVVEDLTTSSFLMALRSFISRRGIPSEIVSDNANTFKLAKTTLERLWLNTVTAEDTVNYISSKGVKWKFNVERAPWWGGFIERMVGLTKRSLIKAVGRTKMSFSEVNTVLAETEDTILNTRPLTYVYDELDEGQALSLTNFLSEAKFFALPTAQVDKDPDYLDESITSKSLMKKLRHRQSLLERFWKIWHQDCLTNLREYHQTAKFSKKNPHLPFVGEIVLVKEEGVKRAMWKLGIIEQLYQWKHDDHIRAAQVRCVSKTLRRAISHIKAESVEDGNKVEEEMLPKKKRKSALKAN